MSGATESLNIMAPVFYVFSRDNIHLNTSNQSKLYCMLFPLDNITSLSNIVDNNIYYNNNIHLDI